MAFMSKSLKKKLKVAKICFDFISDILTIASWLYCFEVCSEAEVHEGRVCVCVFVRQHSQWQQRQREKRVRDKVSFKCISPVTIFFQLKLISYSFHHHLIAPSDRDQHLNKSALEEKLTIKQWQCTLWRGTFYTMWYHLNNWRIYVVMIGI